MTKSQLFASLSNSTRLSKPNDLAVLDEPGIVIEHHIRKRVVGTFTLPGLLKSRRVRKPTSRARTMVSTRTGVEIRVAAKPDSTEVEIQPLTGLGRMVE